MEHPVGTPAARHPPRKRKAQEGIPHVEQKLECQDWRAD